MEQQLKIEAKLYRCRDTAKRFFQEEFFTRLAPYKDIVQAVMKANNEDALNALLRISKTHTYNDNDGMVQMLFMAAVVEVIEPSN
mgnify:CR=1 FL=1